MGPKIHRAIFGIAIAQVTPTPPRRAGYTDALMSAASLTSQQ
jgi:hypothetical protein